MPSFTEYVHLIADGHEAIAVINKINAAIAKMRREASSPINVKINAEFEKVAAGERRVRGERKSADDAELAALKKKRAELAAIVAMNKEQGNPSYAIRFGNQESLAQAQRFNEQLAESTRRINRMADAHKHIKNVAKEADVEVSKSLAEKLASQVATRSEKSDTQAVRDAALAEKARIAAINERIRQEEEGVKRVAKIESERAKTINERTKQEEEGVKRINQMEGERVRTINERLRQEEEGHKRVAQIEAHRQRETERAQREERNRQRDQERAEQRARRERETALASARETGFRGIAGEGIRDIRRNMIYGGIGMGEHALASGFEAGVARSREIEQQYQAGYTPDQIQKIQSKGDQIAARYGMFSRTEAMTLQRHAIGETADFGSGQKLADLAAPFVGLRTAAGGAEKALTENQQIMKGFNELGWVKNPDKMKKAYESLAKMSQVEGANFDPASWLTIIRMAKSAKFAMSDEAMMNLAPIISIGEGAGRTGNEFAMLFKTLAFSGKALDNSVGKTNHLQYIDGTALSDGKGGFNPELGRDVAAGTPEGIKKFNAILDSAAKSKGVNTENALDFKQWLTHVFANQSAQELAMWFHEKEDFVTKQLAGYAKARGTEAAEGIANRDIGTAIEGAKAKFADAASAMMEPFKKQILGVINVGSAIEKWASDHPMKGLGTTVGLGTAGALAFIKGAYDNPQVAIQTGLLGTIAANTGVTAAASIGSVSKDAAKLFGVNPLLLGALAGVAVQKAYVQPWIDAKRNEAQEANVNQYRNDFKLLEKALDQLPKRIANHDYNSGDRDDHRSTKEDIENQLRIALEAQRRNERDEKNSIYYSPTSSFPGRKAPGSSEPIIVPPQVTTKDQPFHKEWHLGSSETQGLFNSGGIVNNAGGTAKDIATSTAKDALAKLNAAGDDAAGALSGAASKVNTGAQDAGSAIKASGGIISGAIESVASAIQGAAAKLGSIGGTPAVKPQATGPAERGNR